ncbi:ketoacyl-ACP synthase III family protein [Streptomyces sp. NPDC088348]|uniref:ketoacyl-ACP synthase III family protein n=1 Tax=Streptomyces sp. NPDC088348 TaxID=3365853 RepID=UPI00382058C8
MPHDMKPRAHAGIAAAAVWLPANRQSCEAAVREGKLTRRAADDLGHATLPVAEDVSAPDMAVRAGESALGRGGVRAEDVTSLYHAYMHYQGHDLWPVAHYIAHGLGASDAVPVGIQQICNGGTTAVELAFSRLAQDEDPGFAVVTTADRFVPPAFDRWTSDYGVAYGDVGTSAVLTTDPAHPCPLLLRSVCTTAAPHLEGMHRGVAPFSPAPVHHSTPVDMRRTKRVYLRANGVKAFDDANTAAIERVVTEALKDTGLTPDDSRLRAVVLPRFGARLLRESWAPVLSGATSAPLCDWGRETGHVGAGDAIAGLAELLDRRLLSAGDFAFILSAGAGFTWSCLAVEGTGTHV